MTADDAGIATAASQDSFQPIPRLSCKWRFFILATVTRVLEPFLATTSAYELFGHFIPSCHARSVLHERHMLILYYFSVVELKEINGKKAS